MVGNGIRNGLASSCVQLGGFTVRPTGCLALAGMALVAMAHGGSGRMLREGLGLSDRRSGMGGCPFMDPTKTCGPPATDGTRPFCRASARRAWPNWQVLYYKAKVGCLLARFWCDNISVLDRTVEDLGQSKTAQSDSGASSDRKSTRLNSSHLGISYAVFCLQ